MEPRVNGTKHVDDPRNHIVLRFADPERQGLEPIWQAVAQELEAIERPVARVGRPVRHEAAAEPYQFLHTLTTYAPGWPFMASGFVAGVVVTALLLGYGWWQEYKAHQITAAAYENVMARLRAPQPRILPQAPQGK